MGILIGPTPWWQSLVISTSPVGTSLPDGSRIICKAGGTAWIVAPFNTEVVQSWNNATSTQVGNKCCICDWPTLNTCLIGRGFNPSDWFVPTQAQLQNPGYVCRTQWDTFSSPNYWSATENSATCAWDMSSSNGDAFGVGGNKNVSGRVRAFRCVTY
jgi:hypothetical protein